MTDAAQHTPWLTIQAMGHQALGRALNEMEEQGYEPVHILHCGMQPLQHPLDPNKTALVPLFMAAGRLMRVRLVSADA